MAQLFPDGTRRVSLSPQQYEEIGGVLKGFVRETKCAGIMLIDDSGLLIAYAGGLARNRMVLLATLAAANYAATTEMARLVDETKGFKVHFHEGTENHVYVSGFGEEFCLVVVFDRNTTFGMVRLLAGKSAGLLQSVLQHSPQSTDNRTGSDSASPVEDSELREELSLRLDEVLKTG